MEDIILEMRNITKKFPGVTALDNVNFQVRRGEIHGLVGENGAGKSTLMKVLSGVHPFGSYEGDILFDGQIQKLQGIADSEAAGIAIVYQELALFPELTVYENLFFGHEIKNGKVIDWNRTIVRAKELLQRVRLNINPTMQVKDLGVGQCQLIEIAKALSKNVKLLILDEPTAALNEDDSENLLELLGQLRDQGVTCILITHRLKEVVKVADTITVLRDGSTVGSLDNSGQRIEEREIIRHMVGRDIANIYPKQEDHTFGEVCLDVKDWTVFDPVSNKEILHNINLHVRKGEIVGIAGLMGAGRTELALSLFGNTPGYKITSGTMELKGKPARFKSPKQAIRAGLAYATENRKKNGLVLIQDILYNITVANLDELTHGLVVNENEEIVVANKYKESINIKAPSVRQTVGNLSGGNQQKVVLARWMFAKPDVLILDEPTRGIDVGAKFEIYSLMNKLVDAGMGIILISSELLEVIGMADRIYAMCEGRLTGEISREEATEANVMAMMTNTAQETDKAPAAEGELV